MRSKVPSSVSYDCNFACIDITSPDLKSCLKERKVFKFKSLEKSISCKYVINLDLE